MHKSGGLQGEFSFLAMAPNRGVGVFVSMNEFSVAGFDAMAKTTLELIIELATASALQMRRTIGQRGLLDRQPIDAGAESQRRRAFDMATWSLCTKFGNEQKKQKVFINLDNVITVERLDDRTTIVFVNGEMEILETAEGT